MKTTIETHIKKGVHKQKIGPLVVVGVVVKVYYSGWQKYGLDRRPIGKRVFEWTAQSS